MDESDQKVAHESIGQVEPQNKVAIRFVSSPNQPIKVDYLSTQNQLSNDNAAQNRHSEVVRVTDILVESFNPDEPGSNAVASLISEVRLYRQALGQSLVEAIPDLLIPRGDGLRDLGAAYSNNPDEFSHLPPIPDKYLLALKRVVKAHNNYVGLDPFLAARDQGLLGPDIKPDLVLPVKARKPIHHAVVLEAADEDVEKTLELYAKNIPDHPAPLDRRAVRYSESVKNFSRATLSVVREFALNCYKRKGKIATGFSAAICAAKWTTANEAWLLELFANNPNMIEVITTIIKFLKNMPLL